jgi:hypothetical protein
MGAAVFRHVVPRTALWCADLTRRDTASPGAPPVAVQAFANHAHHPGGLHPPPSHHTARPDNAVRENWYDLQTTTRWLATLTSA